MGTIAALHKEKDGLLSKKVAFEEAGHRLAAIAGTSTCHVVQVGFSRRCICIPCLIHINRLLESRCYFCEGSLGTIQGEIPSGANIRHFICIGSGLPGLVDE
jgi:hypothetical protein